MHSFLLPHGPQSKPSPWKVICSLPQEEQLPKLSPSLDTTAALVCVFFVDSEP